MAKQTNKNRPGSPLKKYLDNEGISQSELFELLQKRNKAIEKKYGKDCKMIAGITVSRLSLMYHGWKQNYNVWLYIAISDVLGVSLDYLLGRTEDPTFYTNAPHYDGENLLNKQFVQVDEGKGAAVVHIGDEKH